MFTVTGIIPIFMFVIWSVIERSFFIDAKNFKPLLTYSGLTTCAVDSPTQVIPLSELRIGVPPGVPDAIRCAYGCQRLSGCTSFNYRQPLNTLIDTGQCELYTSPPRNCTRPDKYCQHYQVTDFSSQCQDYTVCNLNLLSRHFPPRRPSLCYTLRNSALICCCWKPNWLPGFKLIPISSTSNIYVMPIFESMSWADATRRCFDLSQSSHLIVFTSQQEYDALVQYLNSTGLLDQAPCSSSGYWTAKRRLNLYPSSRDECMQSPFFWDTDNTTSGLLPEQSWESSMWYTSNPSCSGPYSTKLNLFETCTEVLPKSKNFQMNDSPCWSTSCPLCQLDIN